MSSVDAGMIQNKPSRRPAASTAPQPTDLPQPQVWVMCRKRVATGSVENVRAYDDEARARADLELAESVSDDDFWLAAVPFLSTGPAVAGSALSSVQRLALTWLSQGAEAEASMPGDDPVVISPRHVRGFVSVPPEEWRDMEERGWVRNGMITPEGMAQIDKRRAPAR